ncbi:TRPM3 [Symbiodinium natans]|uniref:TRPM3 protein n=1 Tax=Symbiodinium natans TaxID=878477 RepID=A0A812HW15_9DINO|nr:TRPM3 [Symbiodinium natans]
MERQFCGLGAKGFRSFLTTGSCMTGILAAVLGYSALQALAFSSELHVGLVDPPMALSDEAMAEILQRHGFDSILRRWKDRASNAWTKTLRPLSETLMIGAASGRPKPPARSQKSQP